MTRNRIVNASLAVGLSLSLCQGMSLVHAQDDGTRFDVIYQDSAGYTVGEEMIPASNSDGAGNLVLAEDQLDLPDGFVLNEAWQTYSTEPGQDLRVWLAVAADDPVLEQSYASQASHPIQTAALTLNYRESDGTLVQTRTFLFEQRLGSAGSPEIPMYLDQDYVVAAPKGYALVNTPSSQYTAVLNARTVKDIVVVPSDAPVQDNPDDQATMVRLSFYNPSNELIALQTIPFYGPGEVHLDQSNLELPDGYVLDQRWQDYYSSAGTDFAARITIAHADGSDPGTIFASQPQNSLSASQLPGTRRASSVNTAVSTGSLQETILNLFETLLQTGTGLLKSSK